MVSWNWRFDVFNLLRNITWSHDQMVICLYTWESLNLSYYSSKFDAYRFYGSWNIFVFLSCNIAWPRDQRDMWLGKWQPFKQRHHLMFIGFVEVKINFFSFVTWKGTATWKKRDMWLGNWERLYQSHNCGKVDGKLKVLWKWRYNILALSRDITWLHNQRGMLLGKREPFNLSHYCPKFDSSAILDVIFWNIANFLKCFNSPQIKRYLISI